MVIHRCIVNHASRIRTKISVIEQVAAAQEENLVVKSLPGTSSGSPSRVRLAKRVTFVRLFSYLGKTNKINKTFLALLIKIIFTNDRGLDALSRFQVFHPVVGQSISYCPAYCLSLRPLSWPKICLIASNTFTSTTITSSIRLWTASIVAQVAAA